MRSALAAANWLIERGPPMSHLKVQKLLYVAFGIHIAECNEALFYDPVEAWRYGPVVSSVYWNLRAWGAKDIGYAMELPDGYVPTIEPDSREELSLIQTLEFMGDKTASELVKWTHMKGGAWHQTYDELDFTKKISLADIRDEFRRCGFGTSKPKLMSV